MKFFYSKITYYFIAQATFLLIGIIKVPLYTKLFIPSELGVYSWCVAFLSYIDLFFLSWVNSTLWRFIYEKNQSNFFYSLLNELIPPILIAICIALLIIILFAQVNFFNSQYFQLISAGYFSIVTQQALSIYLFFYQANRSFSKWSAIVILQQSMTLVFFLFLYFELKFGISSIFYASILFNILFLLFCSIKHLNRLKEIVFAFRFKLNKKYFKYSLLSTMVSLCLMILNNGDRFIISHLKNETEVGLYSQYYGLATFGFLALVNAFNSLLGPSYNSALAQTTSYKTNLQIIELYILLLTPIAFFLTVNNELIINLLFDESYLGHSSIFVWTLVGLYFFGLYNFLETNMKFTNRLNKVFFALIAVALFNLLANYYLLQSLNFKISSVISFLSYFALFVYLIKFNIAFIKQLKLKVIIIDLLLVGLLYFLINYLIDYYFNIQNSVQLLIIKTFFILIIYFFYLKKNFYKINDVIRNYI